MKIIGRMAKVVHREKVRKKRVKIYETVHEIIVDVEGNPGYSHPRKFRNALCDVKRKLLEESRQKVRCVFLSIRDNTVNTVETCARIVAPVAQEYRHVYMNNNTEGDHASYDLITGNEKDKNDTGGCCQLNKWGGLIREEVEVIVEISY